MPTAGAFPTTAGSPHRERERTLVRASATFRCARSYARRGIAARWRSACGRPPVVAARHAARIGSVVARELAEVRAPSTRLAVPASARGFAAPREKSPQHHHRLGARAFDDQCRTRPCARKRPFLQRSRLTRHPTRRETHLGSRAAPRPSTSRGMPHSAPDRPPGSAAHDRSDARTFLALLSSVARPTWARNGCKTPISSRYGSTSPRLIA